MDPETYEKVFLEAAGTLVAYDYHFKEIVPYVYYSSTTLENFFVLFGPSEVSY